MVTVDDPPNRRPSTDVPADDEIDFNDPDLERFPSDVRSILRTVSQLEDGLEEDPDRFDGVPISPVVGPEHSRFTDAALIDDSLLAQPPSPKMMVPQLEIVAEDTAAEATKKDGAPAIDGKESSFLPLI